MNPNPKKGRSPKYGLNPNGEIMCCLGCGRETASSCGLCKICQSRGSTIQSVIRETKDRPTINWEKGEFLIEDEIED